MRLLRAALVVPIILASFVALAPPASAQNDAGSGSDAGGSFATATPIAPHGRYAGQLVSGDVDFYRFAVAAGASIDIDVNAGLITGAIQVSDAPQRLGVRLWDPNGVLLDSPVSNVGDARVTWPRAHVAGDYRLELDASRVGARAYNFCFVVTGETCATHSLQPIATGTPLPATHAEVLLVPPAAIDPMSATLPTEYLDATLAGIDEWDRALAAFGAKYPQYAYLSQLDAHVEVFEGAPQRAGYDVIIVWAPYTGPIFRGLASDFTGGGFCAYACFLPGMMSFHDQFIEPYAHSATRLIIMSSFAAAPRSGQVLPDFPEADDVYNVMMHEFAHTWGLGHTTTWTAAHGPDLMNSPYAHVFGDGDPLGDGGERTGRDCISSLDLYGMARMYEWVGRGAPWNARLRASSASLPSGIPYELFCP